MTTDFFATKRRVTINGVDVSNLIDITVDKQTRAMEEFDVMDDHFGRNVHLDGYEASGAVGMKAIHSAGTDPMPLIDALSLTSGFGEFDTTNEIVTMTYDDQSATEESAVSGKYGPKRLFEIRQTDDDSSNGFTDNGSTDEAWAQQFIAGGEDINLIRLKLYNLTGNIVDRFDLEIWTDDGADKPDAKLASSNTVVVMCTSGSDDATTDYIGALTIGTGYADATWETIDMSSDTPNILGSATLTIGTLYWLVIRNVDNGGGDDLYINLNTTTNDYGGGVALRDNNILSSPAWDDAPAGTQDLCFVIQFEAEQGHTVVVYDYKNATEGYYTTYYGVKFTNDSGATLAPKAVVEGNLRWTAESVDGPTTF